MTCAKMIVQSRIKKVYYCESYGEGPTSLNVLVLKSAGVETEQISINFIKL